MEEKDLEQKEKEKKLAFLYEALMECPDCLKRMELRAIYPDNNIFHCPNCGTLKKTAQRFGFWGEWEGAKKLLGIDRRKHEEK